jgi:hypothetical protein
MTDYFPDMPVHFHSFEQATWTATDALGRVYFSDEPADKDPDEDAAEDDSGLAEEEPAEPEEAPES